MTGTARLRLTFTKEVRALMLPWLACLVTMLACFALGGPQWLGIGVPVYFFGTSALGAMSIGHEYGYRTLPLLLSQPVRRQRILLTKLAVLGAMLLTLSAVAGALLFPEARAQNSEILAAVVVPVFCGVFLAPWLTMACRNPIAGTIFALSVPGGLLAIGEALGAFTYGSSISDAHRVRLVILVWGMLASCAIGGFMSWRTFLRLEATEGAGQEVHLPRWLVWKPQTTSATATKRHPIRVLAMKELHLQHMTLTIAGLYVLGWVVAISLRPLLPDAMGIFYVLSVFYGALVWLLIGALASAEERHVGTLGWQLLLPIASSKQWMVKLTVALILGLVLAAGLPALLIFVGPTEGLHVQHVPLLSQIAWSTVPGVLLASGGLYVSSLTTSGLRALMLSLPVTFVSTAVTGFVLNWMAPFVVRIVSRVLSESQLRFITQRWDLQVTLVLMLAAGLVTIALRLALANHRSADRTAGRVWGQIFWLAGYLMLGITVLAGVVVV
jgi:hypothetical protein